MDQFTLNAALVAQFPAPETEKPEIDPDILFEHLRVMQTTGVGESSILQELHKREPESSLSADHQALIRLIDSCCSNEVMKAEFPSDVSCKLMGVVACATRIALNEGVQSLSRNHGALKILERLIALSIGWSDVGGNPKELVEQKFNSSLLSLSLITETLSDDDETESARNNLLTLLQDDISNFTRNERRRIGKLEQRMVDAEAGQFKTVQSRNFAVKTLNRAMEHKILPEPIVEFLQGVWLDSLQLILTRQGLKSEEWLKATKLTETLIMTMQPENVPTAPMSETAKTETEISLNLDVAVEKGVEAFPKKDADADTEVSLSLDAAVEKGVEAFPKKDADAIEDPAVIGLTTETSADTTADKKETIEAKDLYEIIENLSEELRGSLFSLEHDPAATEAVLSLIESVHVDIMKGEAPPGHEFEPITIDGGFDENTSVSKSLLEPVEKLAAGQWFVYLEENQPPRHIRLTLKVNELKQLLFTNRNGAKVLQVNFDEFAYLMSSETVTAIPQFGAITQSLRSNLMTLVKEQVKKEKVIEAKTRKRAEAKRKKELDETQFVLVAVRKDQLQSDDMTAAHEKASELVAELNLGATLKLGEVGEEAVEAKLAVDDPSGDKVIFVDNTGLNLGEYTKEEIAALIAGGQCEVVDSGTKEKDNFRGAVSRMRKKKKISDEGE